ncbi:Cryptic phage CTXphi transcriptional repressor RstR [Vibrio crassostreae]|uniref:helix-turn-helix domain-containing protein n=1 Tax=Vibrio crassostreae TaxID=246167 RepID=UPI001BD2731E|nr:helix-turn-helix transcriptional regulator [Vibrio crassostreae]CAK2011413.1 Cryptic phage CTXphi transcriptional repressor RstR [Vibrio crassostreae]CAK2041545.1 Cryptic phage CTXphi transcriptional repressor RstR [Vibrio crassostreae]CAK2299281.1 Cryptic phage CTXphi transcriptional repressor RstR [Vibrio crassostreae]CAK2345686.1 Cryptic phage CTXphi transcriptional repressor RstR [Vibrio crassostreae]CAK2350445.1 Cryptic phage CTXphi transcriptional repressor RstR [Vibrio crassostreae]
MFKENLKAQRKGRNINQDAMAEMCGLSLSAYKKYEAGKSEPTMTNLIKIANTLEMSIDELCGTGTNLDMDLGLKMRMEKVMQLNEEERKAIDLIIQSVIMKHQAEETSKMFS